MWNSYFHNIQKKYSMRISRKNPLVIRLDGKDVTKDRNIDLLDNSDDSFQKALAITASFFTGKYNCYAILGSDEISFIFPTTDTLLQDLDSTKTNHSNEIVSVFSQYFFQYFNTLYEGKIVYWHAKCFSIPSEKITSYIKYRSRSIENVLVTYFLKKNSTEFKNCPLEEMKLKCKEISGYSLVASHITGFLYWNGNEIYLNDFLNGDIRFVEMDSDSAFSDLL